MHRLILTGLAGLFAGCAAMEAAAPEHLEELRRKTTACSEALPAITRYDVDRFGRVTATAGGAEADVIERNFFDCTFGRGRWVQWAPGQPAPMLEPPGTDNPDPSPALRVP